MFHFKNENVPVDEYKKILKKAFINSSSSKSKDLLFKTDFKAAWLYVFGYKISKYELKEYYDKLGKDYYKDGLNYEEFECKAMADVKRLDNIEELRNAFITIDFNCKGFLTIDDLVKQFKIIAPHLNEKSVKDIFKEMDRDGDERISYKDFEIAMGYTDDEI